MQEPAELSYGEATDFTSAEEFDRNGQKWWRVVTKAFEAGDYPQTGLKADGTWLADLVKNTPPLLPLQNGHTGKQIGFARDFSYDEASKSVYCFVEMPDEQLTKLQKLGVRGVSANILGFKSEDDAGMAGQYIQHLAATGIPRVPTARMFSKEDAEEEGLDFGEVIQFAADAGELDGLVSAAQSFRDKSRKEASMADETETLEVTTEPVQEAAPEQVADPRIGELETKVAEFEASEKRRTAELEAKIASFEKQERDGKVREAAALKVPPAAVCYLQELAGLAGLVSMKFSEDAEPEELSAEQLVMKYLASLGKHAAFEETEADPERPAEQPNEDEAQIKAAFDKTREKLGIKPKDGDK